MPQHAVVPFFVGDLGAPFGEALRIEGARIQSCYTLLSREGEGLYVGSGVKARVSPAQCRRA